MGEEHANSANARGVPRRPVAPHVVPRADRHTNAALSVMGGMSLQITAGSLGHADSRLTERFYAHLSPDHIAKEAGGSITAIGVGADEKVVPAKPGNLKRMWHSFF